MGISRCDKFRKSCPGKIHFKPNGEKAEEKRQPTAEDEVLTNRPKEQTRINFNSNRIGNFQNWFKRTQMCVAHG